MKTISSEKLKTQAGFVSGLGKILDVGFAAKPNSYLKNVYGIDIAEVDKPDNYIKTDKCNLNKDKIPHDDSFFDAVIAGDVIEHVENPSYFLREVNRVLKKNGRLVISTPQANDWWTTLHNWFFRRWINDPDPGEHLQNWTFLDMTRLLKKNGFKVGKIEGFYFKIPKLKIKIRVKNFPALSWQVFYLATKTGEPNNAILLDLPDGWLEVKQ